MERVLLSYAPGEFVDVPRGAFGYANQRRGPGGACVLSDYRRAEVHVVLPGAWCRSLELAGQRDVLVWMASCASSVARIDLRGDDWRAARLRPRDIRARIRDDKQLVTHAKKAHYGEELLDEGEMVTIGKRGSRRYLRIYDKEAESHGEIAATRWELELRNESAMAALGALATAENWGELFASMLVSFVDFRLRGQVVNISECDRAPWFAELVATAAKWCAYAARAPRSVDQVRRWVARQCAPALAMLSEADGDLYHVMELVVAGKKRLRPHHWRMIAEARCAA